MGSLSKKLAEEGLLSDDRDAVSINLKHAMRGSEGYQEMETSLVKYYEPSDRDESGLEGTMTLASTNDHLLNQSNDSAVLPYESLPVGKLFSPRRLIPPSLYSYLLSYPFSFNNAVYIQSLLSLLFLLVEKVVKPGLRLPPLVKSVRRRGGDEDMIMLVLSSCRCLLSFLLLPSYCRVKYQRCLFSLVYFPCICRLCRALFSSCRNCRFYPFSRKKKLSSESGV